MAITLSFINHAVDEGNFPEYTFSGASFGAAAADRHIIVVVGTRDSGTALSSVTIGGVAADIVVDPTADSSNRAAIAIANVPTGTTGDIVVTFAAGMARCGIAWWRATGLDSATPSDTGSSQADPSTDTLTVPAGGFLIAAATVFVANAADETNSWSNATTRLSPTAIEGDIVFTVADTMTSGSVSPSFAWVAAQENPQAAFAAWAPAAGGGANVAGATHQYRLRRAA